ncbi:MAG TPA: hypothetical protein PLD25_20685 [Chloroflexota bacterium]|nr:hypothetical protein [Chloroflexota bacterium]
MNYFLFSFILLFTVVASLFSASQPADNHVIFLPVVMRPEELTPSEEFILQITPTGGLFSSTFEPHSFVLTNPAGNTQPVIHVAIDLSTAVFMDMVYDPNGIAGDLVAKDLTVDSNGTLVGFAGHNFANPHHDGYDRLNLAFTHFDPGETFTFSVDVDPTSIRGVQAPGPYESGSVSGLELVGATVTVTFADSTVLSGQTFRLPHSLGGSRSVVRTNLPSAPQVQVVGVSGNTAVVTEPHQTLQIETSSRGLVRALLIEGGLFTEGVPGGGFDLDPFEANTALTAREYEYFSNGGTIQLPVQLSRSHVNGGLNIIVVVQENAFNYKGAVSSPIVLELQD